ncbi:hypothetical protein B0A55_12036 [Friedmanniomyces simplex]|uniref:Uncharacterized protein n=1 Tax=Friedmanniomyces simplex TaxID=329884 RepID=A0A4U0WG34_9PEZI|nr:hypothetical protein B0A55_12036 [Friedmanniomyces simplex]
MTSTLPPPPTSPGSPPRQKLLVIRFLDTHLDQGGIELRTHATLYRMVMLISAIGREIHGIIQSKIAHASMIRRVEWWATCLLEGCAAFRTLMLSRARKAQEVAERLPELEGVKDEELEGQFSGWRGELSTLHVPTGNDTRLFRHLLDHYDETVYSHFLHLHRRKPDNPIWSVNEQLTTISQNLNDIHTLCDTADGIVEELEQEYTVAWERVHQREVTLSEESTTNKQPPAPATRPALRVDVEAATQGRVKRSPIPDEPPRLPPLPFQRLSAEEIPNPSKSAPIQGADGRIDLMTKSFSAVEEQVHHRKHFRSATVASTSYVTGSSGSIGLGITSTQENQTSDTPARVLRPKDSVSAIPRVFTGSFHELEEDAQRLKLHNVETPETQPTTPVPASPTFENEDEDAVKVRDFGDTSNTPSLCPSPVTLLYRREALVSKDVLWGSRMVNGEIVRSRRPSEKLQLHSSQQQAMGDHSRSFESWLSQAPPPVERSAPGTPSSAVKRGLLRQRENTL